MKCPNCGTDITSRFCPECGTAMPDGSSQPLPEQSDPFFQPPPSSQARPWQFSSQEKEPPFPAVPTPQLNNLEPSRPVQQQNAPYYQQPAAPYPPQQTVYPYQQQPVQPHPQQPGAPYPQQGGPYQQPTIVINNLNNNANTNLNHMNAGVGYPMESTKSKILALLLCIFVGFLGGHRFYVGKMGTALLYLFSFGFFGLGILLDFISIICGNFKDNMGLPLRR